jgi:hypothetical protein
MWLPACAAMMPPNPRRRWGVRENPYRRARPSLDKSLLLHDVSLALDLKRSALGLAQSGFAGR